MLDREWMHEYQTRREEADRSRRETRLKIAREERRAELVAIAASAALACAFGLFLGALVWRGCIP